MVGTHESVVTDLLKSRWQDVLGKGPHKRFARQPPNSKLPLPRWLDPVDDFVLTHRHDPVVSDRHPVNIGSQVLQHRLTIANRFDVDDPIELEHAVRQLLVETSLAKFFHEQLLVKLPGWQRMEQLVFVHLQPLRAVRTYPATGNHEVDMRMIVLEVSAPGVEHAKEAELPGAEVLRVAQEGADRLTARFEDRRVTRFRVGATVAAAPWEP